MQTETAVPPSPQIVSHEVTRRQANVVVRFLDKHITFVSFVILLVILEVVIRALRVSEYILPAPSVIIQALVAGFMTPLGSQNGFYIHLAATGLSAGASFVGGGLWAWQWGRWWCALGSHDACYILTLYRSRACLTIQSSGRHGAPPCLPQVRSRRLLRI